MMFKEWEDNQCGLVVAEEMYADWKADREQRANVYSAGMTEAERQIDELIATQEKLRERIRELGELALNWIMSSQQARGSVFGLRDKVDYDTPKKRVYEILDGLSPREEAQTQEEGK